MTDRPHALRKLFAYAGDGRALVLAGYGLITIDATCQMMAPAIFGVIINRVQKSPKQFLESGWQGPAIAAAIVATVFLISAYFAHTFSRRGATRWANNLRRALYEHVQRLSLDFFHRSSVGELAARINQDIERLEITVAQGVSVWWATTMLVLAVVLIAYLSWSMCLLALILLGFAGLWTGLVLPRLRRQSRDVRDEIGATSGTLTEFLAVNSLLKAFNAESEALAEVEIGVDRVRYQSESLARRQFRYSDPLGLHLSFLAPFVLIFAGSWRAAQGALSIGAVVAIWGFWLRGSGALTALFSNVPELLSGIAASERAAELLDERPLVFDQPCAPALEISSGRISFDGVSFAYPSRPSHRVLTDFGVDVQPGETVALVGPTGAGKSTVAQLLLRFYDPSSGRITIDGQDLRSVSQESVRNSVGMVFQEPILLSGSLARNLRLARPGATEEEMRHALEAAHAWGFVSAWESGIWTDMGERGAMLSGGQRQRLAIARVILKDPKVVILDEATSALDATSEKLVLKALNHLMMGRTSLVIAHRIATIRNADRIIVVSRGRAVEQGTHSSLMDSSDIYRTYCREQSVA